MLLPKTLDSIHSIEKESFKDTLSDMLHTDGLNVALADLIFGHYFVYTLLGNGILQPVFVYEGQISYKHSLAKGLPKLHFCQCSEIQNDFSLENKAHTLSHRHYLAKITKRNAFSFTIKQGLSDVGLYNDYPLELCAMCSDILESMREGQVIDSTLSVYLFNQNFLELLEKNVELRQKEITALQFASLNCYKCKNLIDIDKDMWLQVMPNNTLKVSCC